ncbi:MAG TPA: cytochrome C [Phycisphaerae bacterium]|nr:cytochrome C [Phycisphaerae bacterium]
MHLPRAAITLLMLGSFAALPLALLSCNNNTASAPAVTSSHVVGKSREDIGKYILEISGCHDCHTPGVMSGKALKDVPDDQVLTGSILGFNGPWGTSYAANLRQKLAGYPTEKVFIQMCRMRDTRPPMPWAALHAMTDEDLGSVYAYIRSLGKAGEPMPEPLPAGTPPKQPFITMIPGFSTPFSGARASAPATTK